MNIHRRSIFGATILKAAIKEYNSSGLSSNFERIMKKVATILD
jgi:hypothetical protein